MKLIEKYIFYILGMVFSAGIIYASIIKIPSMEKTSYNHETRITVLEKIDDKLDIIIHKTDEILKGVK